MSRILVDHNPTQKFIPHTTKPMLTVDKFMEGENPESFFPKSVVRGHKMMLATSRRLGMWPIPKRDLDRINKAMGHKVSAST